MRTELLDVEPETAGVRAADFLLGKAARGSALHPHVVAVDDLPGALGVRVARGAGAVRRGALADDVGRVCPDTRVADVTEEPRRRAEQYELRGLQRSAVGEVVQFGEPPVAFQPGEP